MRTTTRKAKHEQLRQKITVVDFDINEAINLTSEKIQRFEKDFENGNTWTFGNHDPSECIKAISEGNAHFQKPASIKAAAAKARRTSIKRRKKYTEGEGEPQIDRYLANSETPFMMKTKKKASINANIDIYINASAKHLITSKTIEEYYKGAILEAYKYVLQGRMLNIYVINTVDKGYKDGSMSINRTQLKEASHPIDYKRISIAAYPAFFRYVIFKSYGFAKSKPASNMGTPIHNEEKVKKIIAAAFPDGENREILYFDIDSWQKNRKKFNQA